MPEVFDYVYVVWAQTPLGLVLLVRKRCGSSIVCPVLHEMIGCYMFVAVSELNDTPERYFGSWPAKFFCRYLSAGAMGRGGYSVHAMTRVARVAKLVR